MDKDMIEATKNTIAARNVLLEASTAVKNVSLELAKAEGDLIMTDSEYAGLKNEGLRKAFMQQKLAAKYTELREAELFKDKCAVNLANAEDNKSLAKYLIILAAGKIVA